jgi:hypothetical protein
MLKKFIFTPLLCNYHLRKGRSFSVKNLSEIDEPLSTAISMEQSFESGADGNDTVKSRFVTAII